MALPERLVGELELLESFVDANDESLRDHGSDLAAHALACWEGLRVAYNEVLFKEINRTSHLKFTVAHLGLPVALNRIIQRYLDKRMARGYAHAAEIAPYHDRAANCHAALEMRAMSAPRSAPLASLADIDEEWSRLQAQPY